MQEPRPPADPESPFAYSLEGDPGPPPPALINRYWSPGWNSVQAVLQYQDGAGGHLRGGDPGVRLAGPRPAGEGRYFTGVPAPFAARDGQWYVVPMPHQFGSEELSVLAPGIAALSPHPFLAVHPDELRARGLAPGTLVSIAILGASCRLPLRGDPSLPPGVAAAPTNVPGMPWLELPAWGAWQRVTA
jgi:NADH-quinone oxidoreductase subunit G